VAQASASAARWKWGYFGHDLGHKVLPPALGDSQNPEFLALATHIFI